MSNIFKNFSENIKASKQGKGAKRLKYSTYSTLLIICVLVAAVLVNLGAQACEGAFELKWDVTRNNRYTLSDVSRSVLAQVERDIVIYAMFDETAKSNYVDYVALIDNFTDECDSITVMYVNPYSNPAFANQFLANSDDTIVTGDIIVARPDNSKFRVLNEDDFYKYTYDDEGTLINTEFTGENAMTNAVLYVESDTSSNVYFLQGHEEGILPDTVMGYLEQENYQCVNIASSELENLAADDVLVIIGPQRDISTEELVQLKAFMSAGGNVLYLASPGADVPNFNELLQSYGVAVSSDLAYESESNNYYYYKTIVVPTIASHDVTVTATNNNLSIYMTYCSSITEVSTASSGRTFVPLLTSSASSYAKTDLNATVEEYSEGDTLGPLTLAVAVTQTNPGADDTDLVVFGSSDYILSYNYLGGNTDVFLDSVRWMSDSDVESVSIVGKSNNADRLAFRSTNVIWTAAAIVCVAIPLVVLICGIVVWLRRRHL